MTALVEIQWRIKPAERMPFDTHGLDWTHYKSVHPNEAEMLVTWWNSGSRYFEYRQKPE